ncbi:MAG TPA: S8 family serine peptidase [Pirellulaceae bacterium]|jgi:subtilisin family serine protease|nr:S8 family serine peptidase [Pirellulaceae bacterium]
MLRTRVLLAVLAVLPGTLFAQEAPNFELDPISREITNYETPRIGPQLVETSGLIRVHQARDEFNVDGSKLTVAVLDTGINRAHIDFNGKIKGGVNYTDDNAGISTDFADGQGHGTNVAGVIVANGLHKGIAPGADLVAMKVLSDSGSGSFAWVRRALEWVRDNRVKYRITCVNMSLGDSSNARSDNPFQQGVLGEIQSLIRELRSQRVAVCVAAGNEFYLHNSQEGMSFPAICRDSISVGAVYDNREGAFTYGSGAIANRSGPNVITPFSQRLHKSTGGACRTDIFAPGAPMTSTGIGSARAESIMHGTSQATPVVAGAVLLLQQFALRETGELPTVDQLESWLRAGVNARDGDDERDNVENTGKVFIALDVYRSLQSAERQLGRAKTEFRPFGYDAYLYAYQARVYSAYALAYADSQTYAPYADYHSEVALNQAAAVGWKFNYQAGRRPQDFKKYKAERYYQYANSYLAYLYASYDYWYEGNAWSQYSAQLNYNAYAYGYYDAF